MSRAMTSRYLDQPNLSLDEMREELMARLAKGGHLTERETRLRRMVAVLDDECRRATLATENRWSPP